jgi:hypothetical protein
MSRVTKIEKNINEDGETNILGNLKYKWINS